MFNQNFIPFLFNPRNKHFFRMCNYNIDARSTPLVAILDHVPLGTTKQFK